MLTNKNYSLTILSNNLRVLHLPYKSTSSVHLSLLGKVGRRAEKKGEIGAAHFLEHLSFDGTRKRPSSLELNKFLDEHGAQHNAFTHAETVEYFVKTIADKAEIGFDYLSDTFLNSLLKETEKEKKVITEEHNMYLDNPAAVSERRLLGILYPNLNIGRDYRDENKNIVNFTPEFIKEFYKQKYVAENFILSICGNIPKKAAFELVGKYFSFLPQGKEIEFEKALFEKEPKIDIFHGNFKQSTLKIGFKSYSSSKELKKYIYSRILGKILSAGFSSRLYEKLRSQLNLVYTIRTFSVSYSDIGHFSIETKVNERKLKETMEVILSEIKRLYDEGIAQWEFVKGQNILLADFLFSLEKVENYSRYFSLPCLLGGGVITISEYVEIVKKATLNEIEEVAKEIFSDPPKIAVLTQGLRNLN